MFNPLAEVVYETKRLIYWLGDFSPHFQYEISGEVTVLSGTVASFFFLEETSVAVGMRSKYLLKSPICGAV